MRPWRMKFKTKEAAEQARDTYVEAIKKSMDYQHNREADHKSRAFPWPLHRPGGNPEFPTPGHGEDIPWNSNRNPDFGLIP